jgi:cytoskeletal protein CcmA (bactofilin family)
MADTTHNNQYPTTLGADASFKGELTFEKGMRLLGKFEGQITSDGQLMVAEGATLHGDVKAAGIRIDGQVKGNLQASSKIQLAASARLEGDIQTNRLEVAEGAVLIGRCVVGTGGGEGREARETKFASRPAESVPVSRPRAGEPVAAGAKR